jgi:formylglycine-generating enzyme required for sulfatase activity
MQCQQCRHESAIDFKFCPECGAPAPAGAGRAVAADAGIAQAGDDNLAVSGDVGHDLSIYVVRNYLSGSPQLDESAFRQALARYLTWLDGSCGWLTLRGIKQRDQQVLTLPLDEVYTSLTVEARGAGRAAGSPTVDVGQLLLQGSRLVVTGAPGSGKSTVLQYIAWTLARALRTGDAQLAADRLGFVIPQGQGGEPRPEKLTLPLPISIPLHAYAEHLRRFGDGDDARKATLTAFISDYLIRRQAGLGLPDDFFEQLLVRGQSCLLLLDGLDEVPDEKTRVRVSRDVEDLVHAAPRNHVLVTSRPASYGGEAVLGARFRHLHLQPMTEEQVARLVTRLYEAAIPDEGERARETADLLKAIDNLERLRARLGAGERFVTTPLLVRMIVIVHFSRRQLPEQRAELYREVVDVLLAASYHPDVQVGQALAEAGGAMSQRRDLLGVLAFHMHSQGAGSRLVTEDDLRATLEGYLAPQAGPDQAAQAVETFVRAARQRGSFLDERSGHYQFLHLSFQEFLAARHLAETVREVDEMAAFLEDGRLDDPWWREPALLLIGYLSNSSPEVAGRLARRLARLPAPGAPEPGWTPLNTGQRLAGAVLAAAGILEQPEAPPALRRELADLLTKLLTTGAEPKEWVATGDALARLGDPRPGVGLRPDGLPDIVWCEVPGGTFLMGIQRKDIVPLQKTHGGEKKLYRDATPVHEVVLPTFYVALYPVTVTQYGAFVESDGYAVERYWTHGGWVWRQEKNIAGPKNHRLEFAPSNRPVVGVSWHEAIAFSRWLAEELQASSCRHQVWRDGRVETVDWHQLLSLMQHSTSGVQIRLPTEAEWEKAARGTDERQFPWGDEFDAGLCNIDVTGIGSTSSVGIFPSGASPCGALDMCGNVWEWCLSHYGQYRYQTTDGLGDMEWGRAWSRVLRGGSWANARHNALCTFRSFDRPGKRCNDVGFRLVVAPALGF